MKNFKETVNCRVCDNTTTELIKISEQYIGATFVKSNDNNKLSTIKIPMTLMMCEHCKLVQLKETTNPSLLYTNYFYRTGINDTMKNDLSELVTSIDEHVEFNDGDTCIDIGANDMVMLTMFDNKLNRVGVEPAKNINWDNIDSDIQIVNDFFTKENVYEKHSDIKAKSITCCACFYDMDNPNKVTSDIKELLHDDGVVVIQISYLLATVKDMNWQDIVHEHLEYYSLKTIEYLFEKNGLSIYHATTNFVNGGSLRIYATHSSRNLPKTSEYHKILAEEEKYALDEIDTYTKFNERINDVTVKIKKYILNEIDNGSKVFALAASTKGNMLLQLCGLDNTIIPYISDRNPEKYGLFTLGTNMEVISEEKARSLKPDIMFVLTFHFKDEIVKREKEYLDNGGKLLFVMPYPYYIDKNGKHII